MDVRTDLRTDNDIDIFVGAGHPGSSGSRLVAWLVGFMSSSRVELSVIGFKVI